MPNKPSDFATKVKEIKSQADLIWMSSFAGLSYLTIRSSVYIILMLDPYILNLLQSLTNSVHLHTSQTSLLWTSFQ